MFLLHCLLNYFAGMHKDSLIMNVVLRCIATLRELRLNCVQQVTVKNPFFMVLTCLKMRTLGKTGFRSVAVITCA